MSIGIGETLRGAREEQGRSIEDAARDTRVRGDYLRALEDEQFDFFGGDVYAKGFLSTYARYLKVDAQPLLDLYRSHVQQEDYDPTILATTPVTRQPSSPPPAWIAWGIVAVIVMVAVAALVQVFGGRTPEPARDRPPQPVASATPGADTEPTPGPTASPSPTFEGVELILTVEQNCWLQVEVDGSIVYEATAPAGETLTFSDDEQVTIRFGNAGGVRVERNGEDLGSPGARGEIVTVTFTPEGEQPG